MTAEIITNYLNMLLTLIKKTSILIPPDHIFIMAFGFSNFLKVSPSLFYACLLTNAKLLIIPFEKLWFSTVLTVNYRWIFRPLFCYFICHPINKLNYTFYRLVYSCLVKPTNMPGYMNLLPRLWCFLRNLICENLNGPRFHCNLQSGSYKQ